MHMHAKTTLSPKPWTQTFQNPLIKEYTLNHNPLIKEYTLYHIGDSIIISGLFLNKGILEGLGTLYSKP